MLTKKQFELLLFINERLKETGVSPSFDEMKEALNLKSKSGIHRLITALEERGFIKRLAHRARALDVIKLPDSMSTSLTAPSRTTTPPPAANDDRSVSVPVMGRIAAGTPIEALQEEINQISVPMEMMRSGEHYALEVHGDSMIDAGIFDGDTAIIQSGNTAENGEIIVALVEGHEATLKRLRRKGEMIALKPPMPATRPAFSGPTKSGFKVASSGLSANINLNDLRRLRVVSLPNAHCVCIRYARDKVKPALCDCAVEDGRHTGSAQKCQATSTRIFTRASSDQCDQSSSAVCCGQVALLDLSAEILSNDFR